MIINMVFTFVVLFLSSYALFLVLRYNLHMFQLNGYKVPEHIRWLKAHVKQQWLLYFCFALGIVCLFLSLVALDIILCITLMLIIAVYRAIRRLNNKKPLVYTARLKRLVFTHLFICIVLTLAGYIFFGISVLPGICAILVSLQVVLVFVAYIVNQPIEIMLRNYYISNAKKIIKSRDDLLIIGVTGSYGKTSLKYFLKSLLESRYSVLVTPGNFNTPLGVTITIRKHLRPTHQVFICEMGARRVGEIKEICDIVHPQYGVICAVGPQHLETFHSIDNVIRTKFELANSLPSDGIVFLNEDNRLIRDAAAPYQNKVFYSATHAGSGYHASDIKVSQYGTEFCFHTPNGESETFSTSLLGEHNVINVVGALSVAHSLGISLKSLKVPVRRIKAVEHRMQLLPRGTVTIIDDAYNSNPVGSRAAVNTLSLFDGVRILITPGMVELGAEEEQYNYKFGTYAAQCCDYILLVGEKRTIPIKNGVLSSGFPEECCCSFSCLEDALSYAYSIKSEKHKYILLENDLPDNY